ncbi:MAG: glycosyltransferase [Proteobacteria bacterium]|nr:glycosyltransferase [Pseudomonadota bacterium]
MKVLQINTTINSASTGRIAEDIGNLLLLNNHESHIAFGRGNRPSSSKQIRIGNKWDITWHGVKSHLLDRHGFGSKIATQWLVAKIQEIGPDLIHLHNLHGYYLNVEELFNFLKTVNLPVVWTMHDCWPFTGHCSYFTYVDCYKWQTECFHCPNKHAYPQSWWLDNSKNNFYRKKLLFTGLKHMVLVAPSQWLGDHLSCSFLQSYPVKIIHNGINLDLFRPSVNNGAKLKYGIDSRNMILGVASVWQKRKGLDDFIELNSLKNQDAAIVLVGLTPSQIKKLPKGIIGISRTENIKELAALYSVADVFVNPTWVDNFPTTNIEALACGTPVVTYNTGGSPEAIDARTGIVVERGNIQELWRAVETIFEHGKDHFKQECRQRAEQMFSSRDRYDDYYQLYLEMIGRREKAGQ